MEHWRGARAKNMKNHMNAYQMMELNGREPAQTMKVLKFFKTPLARRVAEKIRIRRRGGGINP